jgi:putative flippase GtrA
MNAPLPRNHDNPASPVRRTLPRQSLELWRTLLSSRARPLRFAAVGGAAGLVQLALLVILKQFGMGAIPANVGAYLLSAQLNFLLSNHFIWRDRWSRSASGGDLLRRWVAFHGSIAGTFLLSQAVFIAARVALPDVLASGLGLAGAAIANFLIQDRMTFQRIPAGRPKPAAPLSIEQREAPRPQQRRSA